MILKGLTDLMGLQVLSQNCILSLFYYLE
jgi:hypothetical protein